MQTAKGPLPLLGRLPVTAPRASASTSKRGLSGPERIGLTSAHSLHGHPRHCPIGRDDTSKTQLLNAMNTLQLKGNWNIIKGKLKQQYADLTDDDLKYVEGKETELIGRLQKRTGKTREEIERVIDRECENCR